MSLEIILLFFLIIGLIWTREKLQGSKSFLWKEVMRATLPLQRTLQKTIQSTEYLSMNNFDSETIFKTLFCKEDKKFNLAFEEILIQLTESEEYKDMPDTNQWFKDVLKYNDAHRKQIRYTLFTNCKHCTIIVFLFFKQ